MGLWSWLRGLLFGTAPETSEPAPDARDRHTTHTRRPPPQLVASRRRPQRPPAAPAPRTSTPPYRLARHHPRRGGWLDLSTDGNDDRLRQHALPVFHTPQELADWLGAPLGRLAWLVHRFSPQQRPADVKSAHYHFHRLAKRGGGHRLIEAPKPTLKRFQHQILREILDKVPPHEAAQGFVAGRSIVTNAARHSGQRVVVRLDLENFYASVGYSRVVAIFRSLGYCREAALWLGRLVTSELPPQLRRQRRESWSRDQAPYERPHLPQGAPSSPALANLSAYALDVRLAGLARTFRAAYSRYADDLTFSGDERFLRSLAVFLPLVEQIVRSERFRTNRSKRRVLRSNQRQRVAGVVVNSRPNVCRADYDRLKAILTNCVRRGPATQNHAAHDDFAAHLRGRIAHVALLNPRRGGKLLGLFRQIDWNR